MWHLECIAPICTSDTTIQTSLIELKRVDDQVPVNDSVGAVAGRDLHVVEQPVNNSSVTHSTAQSDNVTCLCLLIFYWLCHKVGKLGNLCHCKSKRSDVNIHSYYTLIDVTCACTDGLHYAAYTVFSHEEQMFTKHVLTNKSHGDYSACLATVHCKVHVTTIWTIYMYISHNTNTCAHTCMIYTYIWHTHIHTHTHTHTHTILRLAH